MEAKDSSFHPLTNVRLLICHRELRGRPLPLFSEAAVTEHRRKTIKALREIGDLSKRSKDLSAKVFLGMHQQVHVTAWSFAILQEAKIIPLLSDDDMVLLTSSFTLLSLYSSAFPSAPPAG